MIFIFKDSAPSDSRSNGVLNPTLASDIQFTPNPAPLNPGFTWSGNFVLNSSPGSFDNLLRVQLLLGILVTLPDTAVVGISAAVGGVSASPGIGNIGYAFVTAESSNWPRTGACAIADAIEGYDFNGTILLRNGNGIPTNFPFSGVSCCGLVQFWAEAQNGGSVSFDSVSFNFIESTNPAYCCLAPTGFVPEPSTWAMMLIGFAGLGFVFRHSARKRSTVGPFRGTVRRRALARSCARISLGDRGVLTAERP
jgi:PEP-CTERM motif